MLRGKNYRRNSPCDAHRTLAYNFYLTLGRQNRLGATRNHNLACFFDYAIFPVRGIIFVVFVNGNLVDRQAVRKRARTYVRSRFRDGDGNYIR